MKLSMYILADWLEKYRPIVHILDGQAVLTGVRLLDNKLRESCNNVVFVGRAAEVWPSQFNGDETICINRQDWIVIHDQSVETILNALLEAFEFYNLWEASLKETAYQQAPYQTLIDLSYPVFRNPMFMTDGEGRLLGATHYDPAPMAEGVWEQMVSQGYLPISIYGTLKHYPEALRKIQQESAITFLEFPEYRYRCIHCSIIHMQEMLIAFEIAEKHRRLTEGMRQLAHTLRDAVLLRLRFTPPAQGVSPSAIPFLRILSGEAPDYDAIRWALFSRGWHEEGSWYLALFRSIQNEQLSLLVLLERLRRTIPEGLSFLLDNELVMLIACRDWPAVIPRIEHLLVDGKFSCGVSMPFSRWNTLPQYLRQARRAVEFLTDPHAVSMCQDHALEYLLTEIGPLADNGCLLHPAIRTLEEYDKKNGTDLSVTLYQYLLHERNVKLTAHSLFVHRNTLNYRLEKIRELTKLDLDNPEVRIYVLLSFLLQEYRRGKHLPS